VLLVLLPRKRLVYEVVAGRGVPALMAVTYVGIIAANWIGSEGGFSHAWVVPCLVLTFLFGPAGWLSYLVVRRFGTPS